MEEGRRLLLVLKVELGNGTTGAIEVRQGQDLRQLARLFCETHGLDPETVAGPLLAHLQRNVGESAPAEAREQAAGTVSGEDTSRSSSPSLSATEADHARASARRSSFADGRPRSAMDPRMLQTFYRDLERERERRMKALREDAKRHAARRSVNGSTWQQQRAQPTSAAGRRDASKSPRGLRGRAEAALPREGKDERPLSARGPKLRQWMNENCSVAAGERMYSDAMRKIAERRQSVVRAAMEHVASIKSKGRAAGPQDSEFQRLYNPVQYRPQTRHSDSPTAKGTAARPHSRDHGPSSTPGARSRPRSAPRPKTGAGLSEEENEHLRGRDRGVQSQRSADMTIRHRVSFDDDAQRVPGKTRSKSAPRARSAPRACLQDPEDVERQDPEDAMANGDAVQEEAFNRILLEQSSVFQRLYDAAERRKERLEQRRLEESKMERLESKRMSNVSKAINPRSRAMAEMSRGSQDVFKRLYDEGKRANAKKEQEKIRAESNREQEQLSERASEYDKTQVLGPFQPDIGPAARQYHRKGKLLESLDAHGKRKRQELLLRDAVQRAQNMQGCTFHPHIGPKSKELANTRREKSVYEDLYEESVRRRMQRAGNETPSAPASTKGAELDNSLNSSGEGGWHVFQTQVMTGDVSQAAMNSPKRVLSRSPKCSPPQKGQGQNRRALETVKEERLDAIFKLLDADNDGIIQLPIHHPAEAASTAQRLQDPEVSSLIVDALSWYASNQPSTKYGQEITSGDFKRACFDYFSNTGMHASRKAFPWKTILAYDKAATYVLPRAATRALQAFQQSCARPPPDEHTQPEPTGEESGSLSGETSLGAGVSSAPLHLNPPTPALRLEVQERSGAAGSSAPRVLAAGPGAGETTSEGRAGEERWRDLAMPRERQEKRKAWIQEMKRKQEAEEMKECSFKPAVLSNAPTKGR